METLSKEITLIRAAIEASAKSQLETDKAIPPPKVGAAILFPNGEIVTACRGQCKAGEHAEYTLLETLVKDRELTGCVLATTLEPCTKRGPGKIPCCDRILGSGIKEVWVGTLDPNPEIYGHGYRKLKNEGVKVGFFDNEERNAVTAINSDFMEFFARNQALEGVAQFDYSKHDTYTLGIGPLEFKTKWAPESDGVIWCNNEHFEIAPCESKEIGDIMQSDQFDFTSPRIMVHQGEIILGRNKYGHYIAIKIREVIQRKPHALSSVLKLEYSITRDSVGNFSAASDSSYQLEAIKTYSDEWAHETIAKALRKSVYPILQRTNHPLASIADFLARLSFVAVSDWRQIKTEYHEPRIALIRNEVAFKTFKVTVSRKNTEEETISRELRYDEDSWDIDVLIDLSNGYPTALNITRIQDTSTNERFRWAGPLPDIDVKEYL
jgi:pyrimidine deaminase RibD-like protein